MRIGRTLLDEARADLSRPHAFAFERVGFLVTRIGNAGGREVLVLAERYVPLSDDAYIKDASVGASIGSSAIRSVMQLILSDGACGAFHVHMHTHRGRPRFSRVDILETPKLVRSFQAVGQSQAHGAVLLSHDNLDALVWTPGLNWPAPGGRITIVGYPMQFDSAEGGWRA